MNICTTLVESTVLCGIVLITDPVAVIIDRTCGCPGWMIESSKKYFLNQAGNTFWIKQEILFWIKQEILFCLELILPVSDSLSGTWSQSKTGKVNQSSKQNKQGLSPTILIVTVQYEKYILNDPISPLSHKFHFHFNSSSSGFHMFLQSLILNVNFHLFLLSSISSYHQFQFHFFHLFLLSSTFYLFLLSLLARFGSCLPTSVCWCDQPLAVTTLEQI